MPLIFAFSDEICMESAFNSLEKESPPLFIFLKLDSIVSFSSAIFLFDEVLLSFLQKVTSFFLEESRRKRQ